MVYASLLCIQLDGSLRYGGHLSLRRIHGRPTHVVSRYVSGLGCLRIRLQYPFPLISDGKIQTKHVLQAGVDAQWLISQCHNMKKNPEDIFIALWMKDGLFIVDKQ